MCSIKKTCELLRELAAVKSEHPNPPKDNPATLAISMVQTLQAVLTKCVSDKGEIIAPLPKAELLCDSAHITVAAQHMTADLQTKLTSIITALHTHAAVNTVLTPWAWPRMVRESHMVSTHSPCLRPCSTLLPITAC